MLLGGIVNDNIELPECVYCLFDCVPTEYFITHVTGDQQAPSAGILDLPFGRARVAMLV